MKYRVEFNMEWVEFEVEADSEEDAEKKVREAVYVTSDDKGMMKEQAGEFALQGVSD